jgi:hypothetical protein
MAMPKPWISTLPFQTQEQLTEEEIMFGSNRLVEFVVGNSNSNSNSSTKYYCTTTTTTTFRAGTAATKTKQQQQGVDDNLEC